MEEAVLILEETEKDEDGYPVTKEKRIEIGVLRRSQQPDLNVTQP